MGLGEGDDELFLTFDLFFNLDLSFIGGLFLNLSCLSVGCCLSVLVYPASKSSGFFLPCQFSWSRCPALVTQGSGICATGPANL